MKLIVIDDDKCCMEYYDVDTICVSTDENTLTISSDRGEWSCNRVEIDLTYNIYYDKEQITDNDGSIDVKGGIVHRIANSISFCDCIKIVIGHEDRIVKIVAL